MITKSRVIFSRNKKQHGDLNKPHAFCLESNITSKNAKV
jgi:hypothetical protein